jgi:hypothetical protein
MREADMSTLNRRDVVKRAAGLAVVGAGGFGVGRAAGQEGKKDAPPSVPEAPKEAIPSQRRSPHYELPTVPGDPMLERAIECPSMFMFVEEVAFEVGADAAGHDVVFASDRHPWAHADGVHLRHSSMVVFRAFSPRDDLTRRAFVYWRCNAAEGNFQYKQANELDWSADGKPLGPLVLAVRDRAGTIRCYRLTLDYRC